jgi:hypothetical protein
MHRRVAGGPLALSFLVKMMNAGGLRSMKPETRVWRSAGSGFYRVVVFITSLMTRPFHDVSESRSAETPHQEARSWVVARLAGVGGARWVACGWAK